MDYEPILVLAALPAALAGQIYLLGRKMSNPERMMQPLSEGLSEQQQEMILDYKDWLGQAGLEFRTGFQFGIIRAAVFQHQNNPRFFLFMFHKRTTFSAESYGENMAVLDTSNSGSSGLFPRPGAYAQDFPNLSVQELWAHHLEAEAHLTQKFGIKWTPDGRPYQDIVMDAMRVRMKHNRSQSLWPFRVLYRYFVTRRRISNRSVVEQFP